MRYYKEMTEVEIVEKINKAAEIPDDESDKYANKSDNARGLHIEVDL